MQAELSLGSILLIALAVNVLADYVSLLETRYVLGQMHRLRSIAAQVLVLLADLIISGVIIWLAIAAYLASPLYEGEAETFAEILGLFSIFSVLFYSTFLTSVWTWGYILSAWIMRAVGRLRSVKLFDVENQPIRILACVLAAVVFTGALALAVPTRKGPDGLSGADRALCLVFKGPVCLDVATLTETEQAKSDLLMLACEGGFTEECVRRGLATYDVEPEQAARLFRVACNDGDADGCSGLGFLQSWGIFKEAEEPERAARLYRQGCEAGNARACTSLGYLHQQGMGMRANPVEAARLYMRGCNLGHKPACDRAERLMAE